MRQPNLSDLSQQLAQAARDDDAESRSRLDERWDRLAAGTLTEAEHDELRGLADASGEAYEAYQAFRPLGPAFQSNAVAAILARQRLENEELENEEAVATAAPAPAGLPEPLRRKRVLAGFFAGAFATFAAAFLVFHVPPVKGGRYELDVRGFVETRGEPAGGIATYRPGDLLEADVDVPAGAGELEIKLFVLEPSGRLVESGALASRAAGSGWHFVPRGGAYLPLPAGPSRLVVVLARPGKFPVKEEILAAAAERRLDGKYWRVRVKDVALAAEDR